MVCRKGDALDIDNLDDYKELASNIEAKSVKKITVYVDMGDIQKAWRSVSYLTESQYQIETHLGICSEAWHCLE